MVQQRARRRCSGRIDRRPIHIFSNRSLNRVKAASVICRIGRSG
jgi:hypothetical protein